VKRENAEDSEVSLLGKSGGSVRILILYQLTSHLSFFYENGDPKELKEQIKDIASGGITAGHYLRGVVRE
jgi:hypothetical protein